MPPTPECRILAATSSVESLFSAVDDRFDRALHVGLDHDRQLARLAARDLREHLLERAARCRAAPASGGADAGGTRSLRGPGLGLDHRGRRRRPAACPGGPAPRPASPDRPLSTCWPRSSSSATDAAPFGAGDEDVADMRACPSGPAAVATAPRPRSSLASITAPSAGRSGLAFEVEHFGLQQDALPRACRDRSWSWPRLRPVSMSPPISSTTSSWLQQLLAHPSGRWRPACPSC